MAATPHFTDLYEYITRNGVVMPTTGKIREGVENLFKEVFDQNICLETETPAGRLVEALTVLFVNVCGVNAQNANQLNPRQAIGVALDNLGELFGVLRDGETDGAFRKRLVESASRGESFPEAIRRKLSGVSGVTSVAVLNNGRGEPMMVPDGTRGISVSPHSVYICVGGGDDTEVAKAIQGSISAGCGFTDLDATNTTTEDDETGGTKTRKFTEHGEKIEVDLTDVTTSSTDHIVFYRPEDVDFSISVTVRTDVYTGSDVVKDTQNAVLDYLSDRMSNAVITPADIITAIGASGSGIVCTNAAITPGGATSAVDQLVLRPYQRLMVDLESSGGAYNEETLARVVVSTSSTEASS